jgi:GT2 family glycosyltransferase
MLVTARLTLEVRYVGVTESWNGRKHTHARTVNVHYCFDPLATWIFQGLRMPAAVLDVDLARPFEGVVLPPRYQRALALIRWDGRPLGRAEVPVRAGRVLASDVWQAAHSIAPQALATAVTDSLFSDMRMGDKPDSSKSACTIIVCTRNRAEELKKCLDALSRNAEDAEILVVDNAPSDDSTASVAASYQVRYICEPRKGLNWARACGARHATADLILYTDDDVIVDRYWHRAMCEPFHDISVAAVTGLIMPQELETESQELYQAYGGFVHRFTRQSFSSSLMLPAAAGHVGAGASMAFRRELVLKLGLFDCELDCGTSAQSGGDHYAFYRVLREGYSIVYNPEAICWHRDRRTLPEFQRMLHGYSVGVYCFLLRCLLDHHDLGAIQIGASWFWSHHLKQLAHGLMGRSKLPIQYVLAEIRGALGAPAAYRKTRTAEASWQTRQTASAIPRPVS